MGILIDDRRAVLNYLKKSVQRMRELAASESVEFGQALFALAHEIAEDTAKLEAELIEAGHIPKPPPKPANEP